MKLTITNKRTNISNHKYVKANGITQLIEHLLDENLEVMEDFKVEVEVEKEIIGATLKAFKEINETIVVEVEYNTIFEDAKYEVKSLFEDEIEIDDLTIPNNEMELDVEAIVSKEITITKEQIEDNQGVVENTIEELEEEDWEVDVEYERVKETITIEEWNDVVKWNLQNLED